MERPEITTAVEVAQAAGHRLAERLADLRRALEAGEDAEALRLAREITKAERRAA